jgi:hypothetical protein
VVVGDENQARCRAPDAVTLHADLSGQPTLVTGASSGSARISPGCSPTRGQRLHVPRGASRCWIRWPRTSLHEAVQRVRSHSMSSTMLPWWPPSPPRVRLTFWSTMPVRLLPSPCSSKTGADWDFFVRRNLKGTWPVATEAARMMKATGRPDHQQCLLFGSTAGRSGLTVRHIQSRSLAAQEAAGA